MLARYQISRRPGSKLPQGIRQDTRWRTSHPLRPSQQMVDAYLAAPTSASWPRFKAAYLALLNTRFREGRSPFDALAALAAERNVFLGCSCPTAKNPRVEHCHTWLALRFMKSKYPKLDVRFPDAAKAS